MPSDEFSNGVMYVAHMLQYTAKHLNPEQNYTPEQQHAVIEVLNATAATLIEVFNNEGLANAQST